jgi:integrase
MTNTSDQKLTVERIAKLLNGVISESGDLPGVALEIKASRNGKSKVGYVRYNGTPFGEVRVARRKLGRLDDLGLPGLRRLRVAAEDLIRKNKSPKGLAKAQEQQRTTEMTLRQALEEYFEFGRVKLWSPRTRILNERIRRLYLINLPIMDMPLNDIRFTDLETHLDPKWNSETGNATRMRSLLNSTFQFQINKGDGVYHGTSPASWSKTSPLSQRLGEQLPYTHHSGPEPEEVPHFIHHLHTRYDGVPGYATGAEAAYAYDKPYSTIKTLVDRKRFPGIIKSTPRPGTPDVNLIPHAALEAKLGKPKRPFIQIRRRDVQLYDRLTEFLILTPIRVNNACGEILRSPDVPELHGLLVGGLRWRMIYPDRFGGIIEYLPRRRDPNDPSKELPSEHKLGWKYPVKYHVVLTKNLSAIIEEQRQQQIRDGIEIKDDGLVFVHNRSHTGIDCWERKPLGHRAVGDHLQAAADHLFKQGLIKTKKVTPHGLRSTFPLWAARNDYSDNLIDLSLGHILPAIRANSSNWAYYHRIIEGMTDKRRIMMEHWERDCLSLIKPHLRLVSST